MMHKDLRLIFLVLAALAASTSAQRPMRWEDVMAFRAVVSPTLRDDGQWLAWEERPDRGDGDVVFRDLSGETSIRVPRGRGPVFGGTSIHAACQVLPPSRGEGAEGEPDVPGVAVVDLAKASFTVLERSPAFAFDGAGRFLVRIEKALEETEETEETEGPPGDDDGARETKAEKPRDRLVVRRSSDGREWRLDGVKSIFAEPRGTIVAATFDAADGGEALDLIHLVGEPRRERVFSSSAKITSVVWSDVVERDEQALAFKVASESSATATLWAWDRERARVRRAHLPDGLQPSSGGTIAWNRDGTRVSFRARHPAAEVDHGEVGVRDVVGIRRHAEVVVWHGADPMIATHREKQRGDREHGEHAVWFWPAERVVVIPGVSSLDASGVGRHAIARDDRPHLEAMTWEGRFADLLVADLDTGATISVARRVSDRGALSPDGRKVVWYHDGCWHLHDVVSMRTRNLTESLPVPFSNELHDYPSPAPGYGFGGWREDSAAFLVYDRFDVWQFSTDPEVEPFRITGGAGRETSRSFRIVREDPRRVHFRAGERLLLRSFHEEEKFSGFWVAEGGRVGVHELHESRNVHRFVSRTPERLRAREGVVDRIVFTREDYDEFPDLRVADPDFAGQRRVSDVNPQIAEFAWGSARLLEYETADGVKLKGVIITPDGEPGRRHPVLVYYYRYFSQRLHEFNQIVVNHRPCFPYYVSNGYAVFLPDICFEVGSPGASATKCLLAGIDAIVGEGVADPDAIALHGHSWSGYQTAFVITQTDAFKCAVAGAPVANMTSAYSGIRLGSGLARQFQYEQSQSRIGGSLWTHRDDYIANSPVFFADRITTPLLLMFGDVDEAVPWQQGIELYLAMRRLGKEVHFLQYRGEPHHLRKYPNKLDYSQRMKEYLDHHLKGYPPAPWITRGEGRLVE